MADAGFTLDYRCEAVEVTEVALRNSHHGPAFDRGLRDFEVYVSADGTEWSRVITGTLMDPRQSG